MNKDRYCRKIRGANPEQEKFINAIVGYKYQHIVDIYINIVVDYPELGTLEEFIKYYTMHNYIFIEVTLPDIDLTFKVDGMWLTLYDFTCYPTK